MSDDLIERLRTRINEPGTPSVREDSDLMREAADELEKTRRELDIAWAAGFFEGEGCITGTQNYKSETNLNGERRKNGFRWSLTLNSTDHDVIKKFHRVMGVGTLYGPYQDKRSPSYKPQLQWYVGTLEEAQTALSMILPYLGERRSAKAKQCLEAIYVRRRPNRAA